MRYMLDTNICIYAQKGVASVIKNISAKSHTDLSISVISLAELWHGIDRSTAYDKNVKRLEALLEIVEVVPFEISAAEHYGKITAYLQNQGTPIGTMDALIAAHARSLGYTAVTNNTREFERVPGLNIENWLE